MMLDAIDRAKILLKAVHDLLDKQNQTPFVLDMLSETVNYDGCECDGNCWKISKIGLVIILISKQMNKMILLYGGKNGNY